MFCDLIKNAEIDLITLKHQFSQSKAAHFCQWQRAYVKIKSYFFLNFTQVLKNTYLTSKVSEKQQLACWPYG